MKVLVAFDGTDHSILALDEAARIADAEGAEITVFSVVQPDARGTKSGGHVGRPPHADLDGGMAQIYFRDRGIEVATKTSHGNPADEIVNEARGGFDVIVLGARELGPIGRRLGSVSRKVVAAAPCPVVVAGKSGVKRFEPAAVAFA